MYCNYNLTVIIIEYWKSYYNDRLDDERTNAMSCTLNGGKAILSIDTLMPKGEPLGTDGNGKIFLWNQTDRGSIPLPDAQILLMVITGKITSTKWRQCPRILLAYCMITNYIRSHDLILRKNIWVYDIHR